MTVGTKSNRWSHILRSLRSGSDRKLSWVRPETLAGDSGVRNKVSQLSPEAPKCIAQAILGLTGNSGRKLWSDHKVSELCPEAPVKHARAGVSGPPRPEFPAWEKSETADTKTMISFESELRFWWSWARFEGSNELYKIMQITIIVQQGRIKTNE